jgi:hypothetical protein
MAKKNPALFIPVKGGVRRRSSLRRFLTGFYCVPFNGHRGILPV